MEHDLGLLARYAKPNGKQYDRLTDNPKLQKDWERFKNKGGFTAAHKVFFHFVTANTALYKQNHEATVNGGYFIRCSAGDFTSSTGNPPNVVCKQEGNNLVDYTNSTKRILLQRFDKIGTTPKYLNALAVWKFPDLRISK
jgi:hypothetical protein